MERWLVLEDRLGGEFLYIVALDDCQYASSTAFVICYQCDVRDLTGCVLLAWSCCHVSRWGMMFVRFQGSGARGSGRGSEEHDIQGQFAKLEPKKKQISYFEQKTNVFDKRVVGISGSWVA